MNEQQESNGKMIDELERRVASDSDTFKTRWDFYSSTTRHLDEMENEGWDVAFVRDFREIAWKASFGVWPEEENEKKVIFE